MNAVLTLNPTNLLGFLKWVFLLFLVAFALTQHAMDKHPESNRIHQCVQDGGSIMQWDRKDGRQTYCVQLNGKFGVAIRKLNTTITAFFKNKLKRPDQPSYGRSHKRLAQQPEE